MEEGTEGGTMTIKLIMLALGAIGLIIALRQLWIMTPRIEKDEDPPTFI